MLFLPWLRAAETTWKRLSFLLNSHRNSLKWCVYKNAGTETAGRTQQTCQERKTSTCTTFTSIMLHNRENSGGDFGTTNIIVTVWIKLVISLPLKRLLLRRGRGLWSLSRFATSKWLCCVELVIKQKKEKSAISVKWNGTKLAIKCNCLC